MKAAFATNEYRNVLMECGYAKEAIEARLGAVFQEMFYGSPAQRIYHPVGSDMGYIEDTGNRDARTEGMSYGMMFCVQLDRKEEFDRLWKWSKTYMYMDRGRHAGYFAWSCKPDGTKNAMGPAPDGEEYYAMALLFAENRWGNGQGLFNYGREARQLLSDCIHKGEKEGTGYPMWAPENKLIKFIPECDFSDPSYHLPHFYELFALWANEEDRGFWKEAARASRAYLRKACHPVTGLCAEYAAYDGTPYRGESPQRRDRYYSDAYRTIANIGLDHLWFAADEWQPENADRLQKFFCETQGGRNDGVFLVDGTPMPEKALHPLAITATNAQASLAAKGKYARTCVEQFWRLPLRTGERRYYDNCLYLFALLALSGNYRIYRPREA